MKRSLFALLSSAILTLSIAGSAFAVETTTAESLNVPSVVTLSGVPTSLNYGTVTETGVAYHAAPLTISYSTTDQSALTVWGSPFVGSWQTLPANIRTLAFPGLSPAPTLAVDGNNYGGTVLAVDSASGTVAVDASIAVDHLYAGSYTGSMIWELS